MRAFRFLREGVLTAVRQPSLWVIAILALSGEFYVALTNRPYPQMNLWTILFGLLGIIAEAALLFSLASQRLKQPGNLIDSFMTGISYLPQMLVIRAVLYLFIACVMVLLFLVSIGVMMYSMASEVDGSNLVYGLFILVLTPLTIFMQALLFFSQTEIVVGEKGIIDAVSQAWQITRRHIGLILLISLVFVIFDFGLLGILFSRGEVSFITPFEQMLSPQMAEVRRHMTLDQLAQPGQMSLAKPASVLFLNSLRGRGVEFTHILVYLGDGILPRAAIVVLGMLMTPLRMSALVTAYDELSLDVK
jgi:hypothetical protein